MLSVRRYCCLSTAVVGCLALMLAAHRVLANSSDEICDSDQLVTPSAAGQGATGGPDAGNPDHWEPIGPPGTANGMRCDTEDCNDPQGCRVKVYTSELGLPPSQTRVTNLYCACGTLEMPGSGCKVVLTHVSVDEYDDETQQTYWVTTEWSVSCSDDNEACENSQCNFAVVSGTADCDCN